MDVLNDSKKPEEPQRGPGASAQGQVIQQLNQSHNGTRKVGFVITLAGGIAGDDHAMSFNTILMSIDPFRGAVFKNYHDLEHPESEFDVEIYFILYKLSPPLCYTGSRTH